MAGVEGVEDKITADMVVCVCVEAWCRGESWGENKRATMGQGPGSEIQEKSPSEGSGEGRRLADTGSGAGLRSVCFNSTTKLSPCPVRRLHNALQVYDAGVGGVHPMSVPHNWNLLRASGGSMRRRLACQCDEPRRPCVCDTLFYNTFSGIGFCHHAVCGSRSTVSAARLTRTVSGGWLHARERFLHRPRREQAADSPRPVQSCVYEPLECVTGAGSLCTAPETAPFLGPKSSSPMVCGDRGCSDKSSLICVAFSNKGRLFCVRQLVHPCRQTTTTIACVRCRNNLNPAGRPVLTGSTREHRCERVTTSQSVASSVKCVLLAPHLFSGGDSADGGRSSNRRIPCTGCA